MAQNFYSSAGSNGIKSIVLPSFVINSTGLNQVDHVNLEKNNAATVKSVSQLGVFVSSSGTDILSGAVVFPNVPSGQWISSVQLTTPLSSSGTTTDFVTFYQNPASTAKNIIAVDFVSGNSIDGVNMINPAGGIRSSVKFYLPVNSTGLSLDVF